MMNIWCFIHGHWNIDRRQWRGCGYERGLGLVDRISAIERLFDRRSLAEAPGPRASGARKAKAAGQKARARARRQTNRVKATKSGTRAVRAEREAPITQRETNNHPLNSLLNEPRFRWWSTRTAILLYCSASAC